MGQKTNIKSAKAYVGLLNETLKGFRILKGEVTEDNIRVIANEILSSVEDKDDRADFIDYVMSNYSVSIQKETNVDLTSRTIDSVKTDILNNNKVVMENIMNLIVATTEDATLTASIISFNCFDQIKRFYNFGTMATHQWIKDFAVEFENTHKNVKSWEEFLEDKSSSDWEEYLIDCVNQKLV